MGVSVRTIEKYNKVVALVDQGYSQTEACKKVGIGIATYWAAKKEYGGRLGPTVSAPDVAPVTRKPRVSTNAKEELCVFMVCKKSEAQGLLREVFGDAH